MNKKKSNSKKAVTFPIVADALFMIVLPIAGSHGGVVISQKAADMYFASATTRTSYVARGIAGKEAASCVHSHQTAASDILCGVYFYGHVARGIASGHWRNIRRRRNI